MIAALHYIITRIPRRPRSYTTAAIAALEPLMDRATIAAPHVP